MWAPEREPRRGEGRQAGRHRVVTLLSPATCVGERGECWQVVGRLWQVRKLSPPAGIPGPERPCGEIERREREVEDEAWAKGGGACHVLLYRLAPASRWDGMRGDSLETHSKRLSWKARVPSQIVSFTAKRGVGFVKRRNKSQTHIHSLLFLFKVNKACLILSYF